jgi:hypothetical protein
MKVKYKTHPILEKSERKSLGEISPLSKDMQFFTTNDFGGSRILQESFKRNCDKFNEVIYVSSAFFEAAEIASPKLGELYKDIVMNEISDISISGTFIINDIVVFLSHVVKKDLEHQETCFFLFHKNRTPLAFYESGIKDRDGSFYWVSNQYEKEISETSTEQFVGYRVMKMVIISLFRKYASVETKYIAAKSKTIKGLKTYKNETNLDITYLTSKWFTNLVRSEGFSVRGHFRLQPKKVNGEWTKELIWIDSFEKTGYTHNAQIVNNS